MKIKIENTTKDLQSLADLGLELWDKTYDTIYPFNICWFYSKETKEDRLAHDLLADAMIVDIVENYTKDLAYVDIVSYIKKHNLMEIARKEDYFYEEVMECDSELEYSLVELILGQSSGNQSLTTLLKHIYNVEELKEKRRKEGI